MNNKAEIREQAIEHIRNLLEQVEEQDIYSQCTDACPHWHDCDEALDCMADEIVSLKGPGWHIGIILEGAELPENIYRPDCGEDDLHWQGLGFECATTMMLDAGWVRELTEKEGHEHRQRQEGQNP